jgi:hypothetical protein
LAAGEIVSELETQHRLVLFSAGNGWKVWVQRIGHPYERSVVDQHTFEHICGDRRERRSMLQGMGTDRLKKTDGAFITTTMKVLAGTCLSCDPSSLPSDGVEAG